MIVDRDTVYLMEDMQRTVGSHFAAWDEAGEDFRNLIAVSENFNEVLGEAIVYISSQYYNSMTIYRAEDDAGVIIEYKTGEDNAVNYVYIMERAPYSPDKLIKKGRFADGK